MKIVILVCAALFISIPLVSAQQDTADSDSTPGLAPLDMPTQGAWAAAGMGQEMVPIVNDTVMLLKDLLVVLKGSQLAKDNDALIQRAEDLLRRAESAVNAYQGGMSSFSPAAQ
ncbi:MAG: hypothetical protein ABH815_01055 [Candidatus Omnitrophota bacterium]